MHTLILVTHIISMSGSLLLMAVAISLALFGVKASVKTATGGMMLTLSGFISGGLLLLSAPLSFQCVTLTAYLLAMGVVYRYGFGMGRIENARLVRQD
jgi:hypothetical protein